MDSAPLPLPSSGEEVATAEDSGVAPKTDLRRVSSEPILDGSATGSDYQPELPPHSQVLDQSTLDVLLELVTQVPDTEVFGDVDGEPMATSADGGVEGLVAEQTSVLPTPGPKKD